MSDEIWPEKTICYYPAGRISKLEVCTEILMKDWPHQEYRRADLPKEVDVAPLRLIPTEYSVAARIIYEQGWNDCLDYLVALGIIKDKPAENKAD